MTRDRNAPARPDPARPDPARPDPAATRAARGSVHEAIGKLIGDDAASAHGKAEKTAAADPPPRD